MVAIWAIYNPYLGLSFGPDICIGVRYCWTTAVFDTPYLKLLTVDREE